MAPAFSATVWAEATRRMSTAGFADIPDGQSGNIHNRDQNKFQDGFDVK